MRIQVNHDTRYGYDQPIGYSIQRIRMTPRSFAAQQVESWSIDAPGIDQSLKYIDGLGNPVQVVTVVEEHQEVRVRVSGVVVTEDQAGAVQGLINEPAIGTFLRSTPLTAANEPMQDLAHSLNTGSVVDRAHQLMASIREQVNYQVGATESETTAAQAFAAGEGVCQDHSHIFISVCRELEIPARYVTGYLVIGEPDADESVAVDTHEAHHAWAEAWLGDLGWIAFDVSNGICADDRYVRLASGLDSISAAPLRGSRRGNANENLDVQVRAQQQ